MRSFWRRYAAVISAVACVAMALIAVASFTGHWPWQMENFYNSYALQANAWLHGRLDLEADYEWLELAHYQGRVYVSFPPFPSMVLLPFALFFGEQTPDALIAFAAALLGVWHLCAFCRGWGLSGRTTLFWVLGLFLCNGWLFIAANGFVWFFAQNLCFTLALAAMHHAQRGRGGWALWCWACAVGCRPMTALCLPVVLWLIWRHERAADPDEQPVRLILRRWRWALPALAIALIYMGLNLARFGNPLEFGHTYLPEFQRAANGQFSLSYFWPNLRLLLTPPAVGDPQGLRWPLTNSYAADALQWQPVGGVAFYLVNPMLVIFPGSWIYGLCTRRRQDRALLIALPLCTLAYLFIICCHRTLGAWHFGNRYLLDVMPWLMVGILRWRPRHGQMEYICAPYLVFCGAAHLIGTAATYIGWLS